MDKTSAQNLIKDTFNYPFNEEKFSKFSINLLDDIKKYSNFSWQDNSSLASYLKNFVEKYKIFGEMEYKNGEKIVIVMTKLKSFETVEKSRYVQRDFAKWIIDKYDSDACLMSFFAENSEDWRFSLIKIEYSREKTSTGKIKVKHELTPIKRYSYLVGQNEPNYTAQKQISPLLFDNNKNPTINKITEAFSVEPVTKIFFEEYKSLYIKFVQNLREIINKDKKIKQNFLMNEIKIEDFAKKTLGQIVFLYFLQKKGWLGIKKNKDGNFQNWGSGSKNFLANLLKSYLNKEIRGKNFFNDILEPLFYDALNRELEYYSSLDCKLPFLNGGLFEPYNNYNWEETEINIKDEFFIEIFETFNKYNFTVKEDQPLDTDVAIDPEMLGKVFENMLEENFRKGKGSYYTPRRFVQHMIEVSLIEYLNQNLQIKITKDFLDELIGTSNSIYLKYETENINEQKSFYKKIDNLLKNIKICDPAIGSGAFPVMMMQIIVNIRMNISKILKVSVNNYNLKKNFIENSIFGVDIDRGAIDIAKLRLWLSLTIEESYTEINPLPNLDYKIMQGNSLIEKIGDYELGSENKDLFSDTKNKEIKQKLTSLQKEFFSTSSIINKKKLRKNINQIFQNLISENISQNVKKFERKNINFDSNNFFIWDIFFSEVFSKGGFDIIIGNPPYIYANNKKEKKIDENEIKYLKNKYKYIGRKINTYPIFVEKSKKLLKNNGTLSFIIPNNWLSSESLGEMREDIFGCQNVKITNINDKVFENASVDNSILSFTNIRSTNKLIKLYEYEKEIKFVGDVNSELLTYTKNKINYELTKNKHLIFFLKQIEDKSTPLIKFCKTRQGPTPYAVGQGNPPQTKKMVADKIYSSTLKKNETYKKFTPGKDINRYYINWSGEYIKYGDNLANKGNPFIFNNNRILIREIPSKSYYAINSVFTKDNFINNHSSIILYDFRDIHPFIINGILNSKLFTFWFILKLDKMQRKTFPRMTVKDVDKFIMLKNPFFNKKIFKEIINLVSKKMIAKSKLDYDNKIDDLVYQLFKLKKKEKIKIESYLREKFTIENFKN